MQLDIAERDIPLVVDVDGALLKTDLLIESAFALLAQRPWLALRIPFWLMAGKARLKREIARRCVLPAAAHPWDDGVLELVRAARTAGLDGWAR